MSENGIDAILIEIESKAEEWYPERGPLKAARMVGRTPRVDHYVYELVIEFELGVERVAVKLYRAAKMGAAEALRMAADESEHLRWLWQITERRRLAGIPRPLGDFAASGAVVSEKLVGIPLQSMIMKAALLPGYADVGLLQSAAAACGLWLRTLQRATEQPAQPLDGAGLQRKLEALCVSCRGEGLDDASIGKILTSSQAILERAGNPPANCVVLHEFTPLNVMVLEHGVGLSDFVQVEADGCLYTDPAMFLAAVEVLEKYPFCDRSITNEVEERFLEAYGASEQERAILSVMKMKTLLAMFAAGRTVKESAARKKAMWANVMKKFIQAAAERSLPSAA